MKKTISYNVFIRNTIIISMSLIIILFLLYGKYIQSNSIEKSIENDAGIMADLIFQNLYTAMKTGATKDDIHDIVENLEQSIPNVTIELLKEDTPFHSQIAQTIYKTKVSDIEHHEGYLAFGKPIIYTQECLQCHLRKNINDVAAVMVIEFPVMSLQISLKEIVLLAVSLFLIVIGVLFFIWYIFLRKYFVVPIKQLIDQIRQVNNHDDLLNKISIDTSIKEIKQIEHAFNEQNEELVKSYENLKRISDTDGLTGIYNRKKFDEYAALLLKNSKRYNHELSLIVIDLNYFKQINDSYGHDVGDEILILFTQLVQKSIRESDHLFRTGGDEFVLLLPETQKEDAKVIIEKIEKQFEQNHYHKDSLTLTVCASFGIAQYPVDAQTIKSLVKVADEEMYQDKKRKKAQRD